jgi:hypothetical protein
MCVQFTFFLDMRINPTQLTRMILEQDEMNEVATKLGPNARVTLSLEELSRTCALLSSSFESNLQSEEPNMYTPTTLADPPDSFTNRRSPLALLPPTTTECNEEEDLTESMGLEIQFPKTNYVLSKPMDHDDPSLRPSTSGSLSQPSQPISHGEPWTRTHVNFHLANLMDHSHDSPKIELLEGSPTPTSALYPTPSSMATTAQGECASEQSPLFSIDGLPSPPMSTPNATPCFLPDSTRDRPMESLTADPSDVMAFDPLALEGQNPLLHRSPSVNGMLSSTFNLHPRITPEDSALFSQPTPVNPMQTRSLSQVSLGSDHIPSPHAFNSIFE